MHKDLITWCMEQVGATDKEMSAQSRRGASRFLWAPKAIVYGIKYMLVLGELDKERFLKIAVVSMQRNTRVPLVDLVRYSNVTSYLHRYRVNYTNLYPTNRVSTYTWWRTADEERFVKAAIDNDVERFKQFIWNLFNEEYEQINRKHKVGRILNDKASPERCTESGSTG